MRFSSKKPSPFFRIERITNKKSDNPYYNCLDHYPLDLFTENAIGKNSVTRIDGGFSTFSPQT